MQHVVKPTAVVTGQSEEEATEETSLFDGFDRPLVVFVYGSESADDDTMQKVEDIVFKSEKIGLGMKAFRAVRISPEDAEKDALVSEEGKKIPRLLVIDPVKEKVKVLEAKKIKVSSLYSAMKKVAKSCYKENLDALVKKHTKMLNEQDKIAGEMRTLKDKESRLAEKGKSGEKKLAKVREEIEELEQELQELAEAQRKLWKLGEEPEA